MQEPDYYRRACSPQQSCNVRTSANYIKQGNFRINHQNLRAISHGEKNELHIQLEVFELWKQGLGSSLNVLLEHLLLFWFQFGCQQLNVPLNVGDKLLLVKSRLLL